MANIKEIAKLSGVSPGTVSNVLSGKRPVAQETRKRVMKVIDQMHYKPDIFAQGLRQRKSRLIGVITEEMVQFNSPPIVDGIMAHCEPCGYQILLENLRFYSRWGSSIRDNTPFEDVQRQAFSRMQSFNVDGIIYVAAHSRNIDIPSVPGIPMVVVYGHETVISHPHVILDDEQAGYIAGRYLLSMGHKEIGLAGGFPDNDHAQQRLIGFQRALFEDNILLSSDRIQMNGWFSENGVQNASVLCSSGITAVFCLNDLVAAGFYDYLGRRNEKVGDRISVIGCDNRTMTDRFVPSLTTIELPLASMGNLSAQLLLNRLDGQDEPEIIHRVPCRLIERKSVQKLT